MTDWAPSEPVGPSCTTCTEGVHLCAGQQVDGRNSLMAILDPKASITRLPVVNGGATRTNARQGAGDSLLDVHAGERRRRMMCPTVALGVDHHDEGGLTVGDGFWGVTISVKLSTSSNSPG